MKFQKWMTHDTDIIGELDDIEYLTEDFGRLKNVLLRMFNGIGRHIDKLSFAQLTYEEQELLKQMFINTIRDNRELLIGDFVKKIKKSPICNYLINK